MPSPLPGRALTFRARGLSDAVDATNAFPGAMRVLQNLIPSPDTPANWVPRAASVLQTNFSGDSQLTTPAQDNALLVIGAIAYGMIAETAGGNAGKDVPFAYNILTSTFETIAMPQGTAALPTTPASSGDWQPPIMAAVGSKIAICHPGYAGASSGFYLGWLDLSGFTSTTLTGNTHTTTTVDTLSTNVLNAGWQVGMTISDSAGDIPANTVITAIASGGLSLTLSRAATGTHAGTTFTVSGGTPTAPLYSAGNTNLNPLTAPPVSVAEMLGSAFYAVSSGVVISDVLNATSVTNASQAISMGNGLPVTALGALPLTSSTVGGAIQSIIAFQGDANMVQISGSPFLSPSTLAVNNLGIGVGTLAPNTIDATPLGLGFIAPDGFRIINFLAQVSDPIGAHGSGVNVPFLNAVHPSRMVGAFNQNVFRVSVTNGAASGAPTQEYWYDFELKVWSGPHTFPAAQIAAFQGTTEGSFIIAPSGVNAKLFLSSVTPTATDTYVENGTQLTFSWLTTLLPDNEDASMNAVVESTLGVALPPSQNLNVAVLDDQGVILNQVALTGSGQVPTNWDQFNWGNASWGAGMAPFRQRQLKWTAPVVFKQGAVQITGSSVLALELGNVYMRAEELGYMVEFP